MKSDKIIISLLTLIILLLVYSIFIKQDTVKVQTIVQQEEQNKGIQQELKKEMPSDTINPYKNADLKVKITDAEGGTFCYDILLNGSPIIHQPSIPGLPGNAGFKTKKQAQKVANFALNKIRNNQMPPTISVTELDSLNVLN